MHSKLQSLSGFGRVSAQFLGRIRRVTTKAVAKAATQTSTRVRYAKGPATENGKLFFYTVPPPPEVGRVTNLKPNEVPVDVRDLRVANGMTLERNGFELVKFPSGLGVDWQNELQVSSAYPHALLLRLLNS